jgi:carboxymethylenebutenolidase
MTAQYRDVRVDDGTSMRLYVARPARAGKHAGVLVLQEAFGVNAHIRDVTERFAREGYLAVAPELFHRTAPGFDVGYNDFTIVRPHMEAMTVASVTADLRAAHHWLVTEGDADPARTAAVGFCMGGRMAFLANLVLPLAASVSFYGGGILRWGLLERVSEIHAPQMFFWGGLDKDIPTDQHRAIDDAMKAAGKPYATVEFSDAQHGFHCDQRPAYNPDAAAEAWALTLAFLKRRLGN